MLNRKLFEAKELIRELDEKKAQEWRKFNSLKIKIKEFEGKLEVKKARELELSDELIGLQQERKRFRLNITL